MRITTNIQKLIASRIRQGLSQYGLSKKAGICKQGVSRIENGLTPSPRTAKAIADALGVEFDELFSISVDTIIKR